MNCIKRESTKLMTRRYINSLNKRVCKRRKLDPSTSKPSKKYWCDDEEKKKKKEKRQMDQKTPLPIRESRYKLDRLSFFSFFLSIFLSLFFFSFLHLHSQTEYFRGWCPTVASKFDTTKTENKKEEEDKVKEVEEVEQEQEEKK